MPGAGKGAHLGAMNPPALVSVNNVRQPSTWTVLRTVPSANTRKAAFSISIVSPGCCEASQSALSSALVERVAP